MTLSEIAAQKELAAVGTAGAMVSLFANPQTSTPSQDLSLTHFINAVRSNPHWVGPIKAIRSALERGDTKKAEALKRVLPAVTISCTMVSRAQDAPERVRTHSGWLQCDFDAKDNPALVQDEARAFLAADPHVGAVFVGPSGRGIKALVPIDPQRHIESFLSYQAYFLEKYGLSMDAHCKDVMRLCFVSHDPLAWARAAEGPAATAIEITAQAAAPERQAGAPARTPAASTDSFENWTVQDIKEALGFIPPRPDYDTWLRISSAVFSAIPGEAGIAILQQWSPEEEEGEYQEKWKHRLHEITLATLIYHAQLHGFDASAAARRHHWMGRIILPGQQRQEEEGATPHEPLLKADPPAKSTALTPQQVWDHLDNEQIGDTNLFIHHTSHNLSFDPLTQSWRHFLPSGLWEKSLVNSSHIIMSEIVSTAYDDLSIAIHKEMKSNPSRSKKDPRLDDIARLAKRSRALRTAPYIRQVMELALKMPQFNRPATAYDRQKHLLAVSNGVLDFEKQLFRPAVREDYLSVASPARFEPGAQCPQFDAFLSRAFAGDQDLIDYWWRIVGYSLTGFVDHDALFFCYGHGANGKSTAFLVLRMLMGDSLSTVIDVNTLLGSNRGDSTLDYKKSMLEGKRLVITDELPSSRKVNESMIKGLLGGEDIVARRPYEKPYTFSPTHKIWMVGNHKPRITGTDLGIWRRIHLMPWTVTIPVDEQRPRYQLLAMFRMELPGILNRALAGYQDVVVRQGIDPPTAVLAATEAYRNEEDSLASFIAERVVAAPGSTLSTSTFFKAYSEWHIATGETPQFRTSPKLTIAIQRPPYRLTVSRNSNNSMVIENVTLSNDNLIILPPTGGLTPKTL